MNFDVEDNQARTSKSFKRRWKSLPRFVKLYLIIAVSLVLFLFLVIVLPKTSQKGSKKAIVEDNGPLGDVDHLKERLDNSESQIGYEENKNDELVTEAKLNKDNNEQEGQMDLGLPEDQALTAEMFLQSPKTPQQEAVARACKHSWDAYKKYAWGADHLKPITKQRHNWFNVGLTILDAIDTLVIMGMTEEYKDALNWVKRDLRFDIHKDVNCFEMTIRSLGGLLSAFHLTKEQIFLIRASDVGERLIHCFDTPNVIPFSDINLKTKVPKTPNWSPDSSLSEVTTVQLEFRDLSYLTGIKKYEKLSYRTSQFVHNYTVKTGQVLLPMYINPHTGEFSRSTITLGARGDSYYEYLLKQYVQTGIKWFKEDFIKAMDQVKLRLLRTTKGQLKLSYIGEILRSSIDVHPKMDHLVCFLSGTLATGYYHEIIKSPKIRGHLLTEEESKFSEYMNIAEKLARTCYMMYNSTGTGLAPEIAYFGLFPEDDELQIRPADAHNLLRPEFVESLFFLYHITGNPIYRDWGWNVFQAFEKYTKVPSGGFTSINDVRNPKSVRPKDMQESWWFGETLKYLYLLFSDDKELINRIMDNFVFNTEGHLFPRRLQSK